MTEETRFLCPASSVIRCDARRTSGQSPRASGFFRFGAMTHRVRVVEGEFHRFELPWIGHVHPLERERALVDAERSRREGIHG